MQRNRDVVSSWNLYLFFPLEVLYRFVLEVQIILNIKYIFED